MTVVEQKWFLEVTKDLPLYIMYGVYNEDVGGGVGGRVQWI